MSMQGSDAVVTGHGVIEAGVIEAGVTGAGVTGAGVTGAGVTGAGVISAGVGGPATDAPTVLRNAHRNRGTAFSADARTSLGLDGLLPPRIETLDEQVSRVIDAVRARDLALDRYQLLSAIQCENETLFHATLERHLCELLPVVYTPTVGDACLQWSRRYLRPQGLYLGLRHRGRIAEVLRRAGPPQVAIIVVTDGGRILGLGDLGVNGMGIPIGKLALYTACAGLPPAQCLPVTLDVGTDNAALRDDPHYLGSRAPRLRGPDYDAFLDEFVRAVLAVYPRAILQFEDFNNACAFALLERHRERLCCFNDDIQGTGAMGLAGVLAAAKARGRRLVDERFLFIGAGEAGLGVGAAVVAALKNEGLSSDDAPRRCLFIDSQGVLSSDRPELPQPKRPFARADAHAFAPATDLPALIRQFRPSVLFGSCGRGGLFTQPALETMAEVDPQPVVFALSNPTSRSECTAEQAYAWTGGRALFASGSPFAPTAGPNPRASAQANNFHIFPGVGLGLWVSGARQATDAMFLAAAQTVAANVSGEEQAAGLIFPAPARMRDIARAVAKSVVVVARDQGLSTREIEADLDAQIARAMYRPVYRDASV